MQKERTLCFEGIEGRGGDRLGKAVTTGDVAPVKRVSFNLEYEFSVQLKMGVGFVDRWLRYLGMVSC